MFERGLILGLAGRRHGRSVLPFDIAEAQMEQNLSRLLGT